MVFFAIFAKKGLKYLFKRTRKGAAGDTAGEPKSSGLGLGLLDYFVYFLPLPIILFYLLCFTGCLGRSPGIPNLHLISIAQGANTTGAIDLAIGYFGICATTAAGQACNTFVGHTPESLAEKLELLSNATSPATRNSTVNLLTTAKEMQSRIFTPLFPAAGVLFILALVTLAVLSQMVARAAKAEVASGGTGEAQAVRDGRSYVMLRRWTLALLWASAAFALMVSLATTQTATALEYAATTVLGGTGSRVVTRGSAVEGLQWTVAALESMFALRMAYSHRRTGLVKAAGGDVEKGFEIETR